MSDTRVSSRNVRMRYVLALALVAAPLLVRADERRGEQGKLGSQDRTMAKKAWSEQRSKHTVPHEAVTNLVTEWVEAVVQRPYADWFNSQDEWNGDDGSVGCPEVHGSTTSNQGYKQQTRIYYRTPLCPLIKVFTPKVSCACNSSIKKGYSGFGFADRRVPTKEITGAFGDVMVWYHDEMMLQAKTKAAHQEVVMQLVACAPASPDLVYDISYYGRPAVTTNAEGEQEIVVDVNGDVVYAVAPTVLGRFRSRNITVAGARVCRQMLTNFTSESIDFLLPQVATAAFPGGWTGSLLPFGNATLDVEVPVGEDVICQRSDSDFAFSDSELTLGIPLSHYMPRSLAEFDGSVTLFDVTSLPSSVVISFRIDANATEVVAYKVCESGLEVVDHWESAVLIPNVHYEIEDLEACDGDSEYWIVVGHGVNCVHSVSVEVVR